MRVLILGAKGMLGTHLVREFSDKHDVLAWGREELDITDAASVAKMITSDIDAIINAAGIHDPEIAEADPEKAMRVNAYPVGTLADICNMLGMQFVTFSSEHVFSGKNTQGNREREKAEPLSALGRSKALAEKFALEDNDQTYLIRTSRLFGAPGESRNAREQYLNEVLSRVQSGGVIDAVHDEVASPTYAGDVAQHVRMLLEQKKPYGTYHLVNGGYATWYQFAKKVVELSGKDIPVTARSRKEIPATAQAPRYGMLVNTRLPQLRSWEESLAEYLKAK